MRKPDWLKVPLPNTREFIEVRGLLDRLDLHSVCQEARCPNMGECFQSGTATFLILGNTCTRNCRYCNVRSRTARCADEGEPERLAAAVKALGLRYVVITSVTRDDLTDGGASLFARCVELLRQEIADCRVEVLIPDLEGNWKALERILASGPHVLNHNVEVVPRLFRELRPQGNYTLSLELLQRAGTNDRKAVTKSGFMIGFGETPGRNSLAPGRPCRRVLRKPHDWPVPSAIGRPLACREVFTGRRSLRHFGKRPCSGAS